MLQPHFGLNQPYTTARIHPRPVNGSAIFDPGQWVKIVNGSAVLATTPADGWGAEQVNEPNNKNNAGMVSCIDGSYEASTDQYVTASTYADRAKLVVRNGVLDVSAGATEDQYAVGFCIGLPANGVIRFKRF